MMGGAMNAMMGWMMGLGMLGAVLVLALLATLIVLVVQAISRRGQDGRH